MTLPEKVIREDHRLERAASSASEDLARLRWHWTLDETNADRVGVREYARSVGRQDSTIQTYARGYQRWAESDRTSPVTETIKRAAMSADREAATDAVAKARGIAFGTVKQTRPAEVKRVRDMARERVEKFGGTIEEQTAKAADWVVRSEKAAASEKDSRRQRFGVRFITLEERLQRVRRELIQAVNEAHAVEWGSEEEELLRSTLENVRSLLELLSLAMVGDADVDWDAELAELGR